MTAIIRGWIGNRIEKKENDSQMFQLKSFCSAQLSGWDNFPADRILNNVFLERASKKDSDLSFILPFLFVIMMVSQVNTYVIVLIGSAPVFNPYVIYNIMYNLFCTA